MAPLVNIGSRRTWDSLGAPRRSELKGDAIHADLDAGVAADNPTDGDGVERVCTLGSDIVYRIELLSPKLDWFAQDTMSSKRKCFWSNRASQSPKVAPSQGVVCACRGPWRIDDLLRPFRPKSVPSFEDARKISKSCFRLVSFPIAGAFRTVSVCARVP